MLRKSYKILQKTRDLVEKAGQGAQGWVQNIPLPGLAEGALPRQFACCPPDPWSGNAERGRELLAFVDQRPLAHLLKLTSPKQAGAIQDSFHRFDWLPDLRADGSAQARTAAVRLLAGWIQQNTAWDGVVWRADIMGERLMRWSGAYAFLLPALDTDLNEKMIASTARQARHLKRAMGSLGDPIAALGAACGLTAAGIALGYDRAWIEPAAQMAGKILAGFILSDGGPISRRPSDLLDALRLAVELQGMIVAAGHSVPQDITHAIDRMVPALRFFRHADKRLPGFQGGQPNEADRIDEVLRASGGKGKAVRHLPHTGYERLMLGKTSIVMDTSCAPEPGPHTHLSPLAFEMVNGGDRLFVNCGQHASDPMWREFLVATAAHNTLTLDNFDAASRDGQGPSVIVESAREETEEAALIDAGHNGYVTRNGFSHRRRLYLCKGGNDLRGEETLSTAVPPTNGVAAAVRFHLHPKVTAAFTNEGAEILLRTASGQGWRFHHQGGRLAIEDSIYLADTGAPQKTKQIVIYDTVHAALHTLRWAVQKVA